MCVAAASPPRCSISPTPRPGIWAVAASSSTPRPTLASSTSRPATGPGGGCSGRPGSSTSRWRSTCTSGRGRPLVPEVRIDPLTGLRSIVAGDRATRPGGGLSVAPAPELDPETDPFADGHEDRTPPEVYALRPNGGGPDTRGWRVRVVPNLYPALSPDSPEPPPDAN